ncbi:hypothetical protein HY440_00170 [Candidatus Microgenomates bacterium]|nr:hypothetical protein [Candidatus Microgenomates bacterium]
MDIMVLLVVCLTLLANLAVCTVYDLVKKQYWHALVSLTLFSGGATVFAFGFRL